VLGTTHRAKLSLLIDVSRKGFIVILPGTLGIKGEVELLVPVESVTGTAQLVVAIAGTRAVTGDVSGVGSDLVGDQTFAHVLGIGQTEMLLGGDIAEHRRAVPAGHGCTDR